MLPQESEVIHGVGVNGRCREPIRHDVTSSGALEKPFLRRLLPVGGRAPQRWS